LAGASNDFFNSAIILSFAAYAFSVLTPLLLNGSSLTCVMVAFFLSF
jgi:hypothetical protein